MQSLNVEERLSSLMLGLLGLVIAIEEERLVKSILALFCV
jgi:hypothetical protein